MIREKAERVRVLLAESREYGLRSKQRLARLRRNVVPADQKELDEDIEYYISRVALLRAAVEMAAENDLSVEQAKVALELDDGRIERREHDLDR